MEKEKKQKENKMWKVRKKKKIVLNEKQSQTFLAPQKYWTFSRREENLREFENRVGGVLGGALHLLSQL
jgi:hypothetical protein